MEIANIIYTLFIVIVVLLFVYVHNLNDLIKEKERVIQNQKIMQQKQQQETKNKQFETKWKIKKESLKEDNYERDNNISIPISNGNNSIDF